MDDLPFIDRNLLCLYLKFVLFKELSWYRNYRFKFSEKYWHYYII